MSESLEGIADELLATRDSYPAAVRTTIDFLIRCALNPHEVRPSPTVQWVREGLARAIAASAEREEALEKLRGIGVEVPTVAHAGDWPSPSSELVDVLVEICRSDPSPGVRAEALQALAAPWASKRAVTSLYEAYFLARNEAGRQERSDLAYLVTKMAATSKWRLVVTMFEDAEADDLDRSKILFALSRRRLKSELAPVLSKWARDPGLSLQARARAAEVLAKWKIQGAAEMFDEILQSEHARDMPSGTREDSIRMLAALRRKDS